MLREQLGEVGMGAVYVAEQTESAKRKVALRIIKPGMDSQVVLARFEAERRALAMMDHPNIARIFELLPSGDDADGLVVELDPITGDLLAANGFGGDVYDRVRVMQVDDNGIVYAAGWTSSLDSTFPNVDETFASAGGNDGFVAVFTPTSSFPPVADAGPGQAGLEDHLLTFDASGSSSDPDGDPSTYCWDFGDGQTEE